ncbi:MAG: PAS domain S-box protein [Armatimonadota bacterium]|nr:PAS domain S-box protein [Armatimonadota bacterium]MDR7427078.1 PAS domain S-box protein [Armatimonadota bacterium]MDR7464086.1 PAS domain S-box protein [Armatimonadota bacterium]MDR7473642.1 PAS domain S-box protein [Armatimonadota bacterium]MDR7539401.1 PAS domain S-box protein [Armatimonadota bacterium]
MRPQRLTAAIRWAGATLLGQFTLLALLLTALVAAGFAWVVSRQMVQDALDDAARQAARVVQLLITPQVRAEDFALPTPMRVAAWRALVGRVVDGADIVRIKVWNARGQVVYADAADLIGRVYPLQENSGLADALQGRLVHQVSGLEKAENALERNHRRLLEVYVPVTLPDRAGVAGVYEVYRSFAPLQARIDRIRRLVWGGAAAAFALLYASCSALVSRVSRRFSALASFPEQNPDPVVETDLSGKITYMNPQASVQLPDLRAAGRQHPLLADLPDLLAELGDRGKGSLTGVTKVGETFYQRFVYPTGRDRLRLYIHDVTEALLAEEQVRKLSRALEQTADLVMITSRDGAIEYVNGAFEDVTGYAREEVIGRTPRVLKAEGNDPRVYEQLWKTILAGKVFRGVLMNRKKNGEVFYADQTITPVLDGDGSIMYFVSTARDVTARQQAEEEIRRLNAQLEQRVAERTAELHRAKEEAERASVAKSEFLSRMSHELRTPLNAILGFAQLLEMEPLPPEQRESVAHILQGGRHLLQLINEVLDISRIEAGRLTLSPEPVHAAGVLQEVVDLIAPLAAQRGVRLGTEATDGDAFVLADLQRLKQVLLNLLSNAVKYNVPGGSVTVSCEPSRHGWLRLSVRDTGRGIPPEKLDQVFVPFARLGAEQTGVEGTGIGLALSKGLVEVMGGEMGVESVVAKGSTFWVELPLAESSPQRGERMWEEPFPPPGEEALGVAGGTILHIEDNLANVELLQRILEDRPRIRLLAAMQGRMGLDLARQHRPDLILLDVHLPDLSGEEVLRRLQADPRTRFIPVIVITADSSSGQTERLLAIGAAGLLRKPVEIQELLRTLDEALRRVKGRHAGPVT